MLLQGLGLYQRYVYHCKSKTVILANFWVTTVA